MVFPWFSHGFPMVLTEAQLVTSVKVTQEVDSDGEEVQLCCQCGLPVGETAYRPEEKDQGEIDGATNVAHSGS